MKFILLWSDIFLLLLTMIAIFLITKIYRQPQMRYPWRQIFASRTGMASFLILMAYILIALLDSIHLQRALDNQSGKASEAIIYETKIVSALDLLLGTMAHNTEQTYSAPFALTAFKKETRVLAEGMVVRDYPRLQFAGNHLALSEGTDKDWQDGFNDKVIYGDIAWQSLKALLLGGGLALMLIGLHQCYLKKGRSNAHSQVVAYNAVAESTNSTIAWSTGYITLTLIVCCMLWFIMLGNLYHVLGTDMAGNDVLYKSIKGIRTGVLIGTLTTLIMLPIAIILGLASGYFKGWIDDMIQFLYTTLGSIPSVLLIASSILLFDVFIENNRDYFELGLQKADARFMALCFILGITQWSTLCRLLRGESLKISQLDYVQAAQAFGVSHTRILFRHMLPNLSHIIFITVILDFSTLVLAESVLSYIGIGVDPNIHSWGNMIQLARTELARDPVIWWTLTGAFFWMFILVLAANLFSEVVQKAFDDKAL